MAGGAKQGQLREKALEKNKISRAKMNEKLRQQWRQLVQLKRQIPRKQPCTAQESYPSYCLEAVES